MFVYVCGGGEAHHSACVKVRAQLPGVSFFFLNVGPGDQTHAVSLGSKGLYPPSRPARQGFKVNGFIRRNVIMMITDIYWAVAVGELSNLPALSL